MRIVRKCMAFSPKERYADMKAVKKELLGANPKSQFIRKSLIFVCAIAVCALLVFGGAKLYRYITYSPFNGDVIPAYLSDEERTADSVAYMKEKFGTSLFDGAGDVATVGFLHQVLVDVYGLDGDYACGINNGVPGESEAFFLPWGWDDGQNVDRDVMVYVAVKLYDPSIVADWSSLKDDNGYYPGVRVAVAFAEKTGLATGANRPGDITIGDMAIILANTDRVFSAAETEN